jgi:hypothetical protein
MTIATEYFNYQKAGTSSPLYAKGEAPGLRSVRQHVMTRYGGINLGSFGVRPIRSSDTVLSTHAYGAAWDWRYVNADGTGLLGRAKLLNIVLPFLINNSQELGIQMIGDYIGCRIWKADRSGDVNKGWKTQTPDGHGMGQPWAGWLHIELHPREWADGATVESKLGVQGFPPFNPAQGQLSLYPWAANKPTLRIGSTGDTVRYFQGGARKLGYGISVDGSYGNQSAMVARDFQAKNGLAADGIVGPLTWAKFDARMKLMP